MNHMNMRSPQARRQGPDRRDRVPDDPRRVAIGVGSNLGSRERWLAFGVRELSKRFSDLRCSRVYVTEPVGRSDQSAFLNLCCVGRTRVGPEALMEAMRRTEARAGRNRSVGRWGPRTLDLDLLLYGDRVLESPGLRVPHPRMTERGFVLVPLSEVAPNWRHPVTGRTIRELLRGLESTGGVRPWDGSLPPPLRACRERGTSSGGRGRSETESAEEVGEGEMKGRGRKR